MYKCISHKSVSKGVTRASEKIQMMNRQRTEKKFEQIQKKVVKVKGLAGRNSLVC